MKPARQRKNNKDHVKEATKRLGIILRNSRKLGVLQEDLAQLKSVADLKSAVDRISAKYKLPCFAFVTVLIGALLLYLTLSTGLYSGLDCKKNTSHHMLPVHTIRMESALKFSSTKERLAELEEDLEDSRLSDYPWLPSKMNLQRDR